MDLTLFYSLGEFNMAQGRMKTTEHSYEDTTITEKITEEFQNKTWVVVNRNFILNETHRGYPTLLEAQSAYDDYLETE